MKNITVYAIINQYHVVHKLFKTRKEALNGLKNFNNTDDFYYFTQKIKVKTNDFELI